MTEDNWLINLRNGDEVFWEDPDDGISSRYITIQEITINGEVISILDKNGNFLECFAHELR